MVPASILKLTIFTILTHSQLTHAAPDPALNQLSKEPFVRFMLLERIEQKYNETTKQLTSAICRLPGGSTMLNNKFATVALLTGTVVTAQHLFAQYVYQDAKKSWLVRSINAMQNFFDPKTGLAVHEKSTNLLNTLTKGVLKKKDDPEHKNLSLEEIEKRIEEFTKTFNTYYRSATKRLLEQYQPEKYTAINKDELDFCEIGNLLGDLSLYTPDFRNNLHTALLSIFNANNGMQEHVQTKIFQERKITPFSLQKTNGHDLIKKCDEECKLLSQLMDEVGREIKRLKESQNKSSDSNKIDLEKVLSEEELLLRKQFEELKTRHKEETEKFENIKLEIGKASFESKLTSLEIELSELKNSADQERKITDVLQKELREKTEQYEESIKKLEQEKLDLKKQLTNALISNTEDHSSSDQLQQKLNEANEVTAGLRKDLDTAYEKIEQLKIEKQKEIEEENKLNKQIKELEQNLEILGNMVKRFQEHQGQQNTQEKKEETEINSKL